MKGHCVDESIGMKLLAFALMPVVIPLWLGSRLFFWVRYRCAAHAALRARWEEGPGRF